MRGLEVLLDAARAVGLRNDSKSSLSRPTKQDICCGYRNILINRLMTEIINSLFPCLWAMEVMTVFSNKLGTESCMSSSSHD